MKKICSGCGKIIDFSKKCECMKEKEKERSRYNSRNATKSQKLLNTTKWRKLRKQILNRDNHYCQRCLHKFGIINGDSLEVHHIKPRNKYIELMYEPSNLITLCSTCNLQIGTKEELDFEINEKEEIEYNL